MSQSIQYPVLISKQNFQTETQQRCFRVKPQHRLNDLNTHLQNIPPKDTKFRFFSEVQKLCFMMKYTLGQKASLNKYRRIKIISHILPYFTKNKQEGKREKNPKNVFKYIKTEQYTF